MNIKRELNDIKRILDDRVADKLNNSIAEDIAGVVIDLNKIIKALKDAGLMSDN